MTAPTLRSSMRAAAALALAGWISATGAACATADFGTAGEAAELGGSSSSVASSSSFVPSSSVASSTPSAIPGPAAALLQSLSVKGRAPKTGYTRSQFGSGWIDDVDVELGHNGCDTRNDVLRRDLTDVVAKLGTRDCVVASGTLRDPYTGKTIAFVRGNGTSNAVQIDHVVALADSWQKGAQQLTAAERAAFANDPRNLQAVDGPTNQKKGAGDAATWLPPNKSYRCEYVTRQIHVKAAYRLWVTAAEKTAMERVLSSC